MVSVEMLEYVLKFCHEIDALIFSLTVDRDMHVFLRWRQNQREKTKNKNKDNYYTDE